MNINIFYIIPFIFAVFIIFLVALIYLLADKTNYTHAQEKAPFVTNPHLTEERVFTGVGNILI